VFDYVKEYDY
jgi:hypothetical protein